MAISTQIDDYTLNFSENLEGNVMLENLRSQREMGKFCDIVLHVQGKRFPAHRSVLAASSPYFESVLKNHRVTKEEITIGWHDVKTFEILLDYMYTGNVVINETNVYELLKLSNHFLISKLKNYTGQYLEKFMTPENCLNIKELADKYNLTTLQESALNVIRDNITSVLESGPLMELSAKKFELFITDPGTGCDTVSLSLLLNAISSWVKMDIPRRSNDLSRLLDVINWKENDTKEVFAHIENETLYQENGWCLYLILKTLIVNEIDLQGKFVSQYESLRKFYENKLNSNETASNEIIVAGTSLDDLEESKEEAFIDDTPIIVEPVEVMTDATPVSRRRNRKRAITIKAVRSFGNEVVNEPNANMKKIKTKEERYEEGDQEENHEQDYDHEDQVEYQQQYQQHHREEYQEEDHDGAPKNVSEEEKEYDDEHDGGGDVDEEIEDEYDEVQDDDQIEELIPKNRKRNVNQKYSSQEWVTDESANRKKCDFSEIKKNKIGPIISKEMSEEDVIAVEAEAEGENFTSIESEYEDFDTEHSLEDEAPDGKGIFRTEYTIRGKKHSASLAQWREGVKCPHCIYIGHSATRLEQHLARVHEEDTTYKCRLCDFTCKWNREYYKHMKTHFEGPPYKCQDCDYTCDRIQFILSHRMRHTDERPFHCELCSFKSRTKGNLIVHMRIHTGEKPYKCQYCGRCFAMKNTLDQHLATHRDDRPFLCDTCGFTTKYQSHLLSHKRIHTGNVFHCQQQGCSYFSPRRSQLAAHMRSHLSIRSHICSTCGRGFIEKSHLIRHERIHLDEKPFKCDLCDYGSTRRDKLKEHVIKHHSGDNSNKTPYKPRKPKKQNSVTIVEEGSLPTVGEECQLIVTSSPQDVQISQNEQEVATANLIYEYSSSGLTVGHTRVVIQSAMTDYTDNMILN